ncbi:MULTISPECIES: hypothetical protein [Staphylococcus]|uniref:Uncharacterized protein n=1 Tax=Staphylococcus chromogenes TaxID=46126 RepID=A0ABD5AXY9_STACR|nr:MULTISPECIES: hypothetical protein [Staphylococcus]KDP12459.1 hypothetical protein SCHR_08043 [Staphylococcus chromogenes MU 970]MBP0046570.1 hypothetical protein [Staphylococcus chromogenes]MBV5138313.1 hypothetical protein [Staphylococcus chromogenes]MBV5191802.1 hypothetical protein [Staphylococcus chromogenes]MBW3133230.1 hypothetical protein [Staphylococcus chromogenes]
MLRFIGGIFKVFFALMLVLTVLVGATVAVLAVVFKKDFEDIENKTKQIIADIEANQA